MHQKLSVIIPIYNEAATTKTLLHRVYAQEIPRQLAKEMIIVESNSSDGTREIALSFRAWATSVEDGMPKTTVRLILQDKSLGKGNAVRDGLRFSTGDIILIQDGDLEYDTSDYPKLLKPILANEAHFVLGSRHLAVGSWKVRRLKDYPATALLMNVGGRIFHAYFNLVYSTQLTDPTTMYKVFRRSCLQNIFLESNRFDFDFELTAKLIRLGFPPLEVPVSYRSRSFRDGKKINGFRDPFMWIWAIFKFRWSKLRRVPSPDKFPISSGAYEIGDS